MASFSYQLGPTGNLTNVYYFGATPAVSFQFDALNRLTNMVDGVGTSRYTYTSGGFLATEGGVFANDVVTNIYTDRLSLGLSLAQEQPAEALGGLRRLG